MKVLSISPHKDKPGFEASLECEHCGHKQTDNFAEDSQQYRGVYVPQYRFCEKCLKNSLNRKIF